MLRQLLPWRCIVTALFILVCVEAASAATHFVGWRRIGIGPSQTWYWNPTNLVIAAGDTVMWTNLGSIHSVNPAPNPNEPFCGTGTNLITACTVTFLTPGFYPYDCYQHLPTMTGTVRVLVGPVVAITNPPDNSIFSTHANVTLRASATDADGAVTNVQFLNNGVSFSTSTAAPYAATLSNVAPGHYSVRARAVDNSALVTTSAAVIVRVVAPPILVVTNSATEPLRFTYNSSTGVSYVVEGAVTLTNFLPIVTNAGSGGAQQFAQTNPAPAQKFFRLRLQ